MNAPYAELMLPEPLPERPYVVINMVATIDGKVVVRDDGREMGEMGSDVDHQAMRNLEAACDGTLIGAGTLRGAPANWAPTTRVRATITASGRVPWTHGFLNGDGVKPVIFAASKGINPPEGMDVRNFEGWSEALFTLRDEFGVRRLVVEGGPPVNAALISHGLADEVFITVAPMFKLGSGPTMASGDPLKFAALKNANLISCHAVGDEVFLRYRLL